MRFAWNLEIDIIVLFITAFIIYRSSQNNSYSINRSFRVTAYLNIMLAITDCLWSAITTGVIVVPLWFAYAVNVTYLWSLALIGYYWFIYSESVMNMKWTQINKWYAVFAIPEIILLMLLIMSYWNGLVFRITDDFVYERGPLLFVATIVDVLYPFITAIRSFSRSFKKKYYVNRLEFRNMACFVVFPGLGAVLLFLDPNAPYMPSSIMLALVFTFFSIEDTVIRTDSLTGMPNKRKLYPYVDKIIEAHNDFSNKDFYLILVEITNLKEIINKNSNIEGDHAIMLLAEVIRKVCDKYNSYGARYADNQFCIAFETEEPDEINPVMKDIEKLLSEVESVPYHIEFRYGYARYDTVQMDCVKAIVEVATERLKAHEYGLNP